MNSGIEYITVNEGLDLWLIDYDEYIATYKETDSSDWYEYQGIEITNLEGSIYEYLEDQNYNIDEGEEEWNTIKFTPRTFIKLQN